jgi:hypothetical protein
MYTSHLKLARDESRWLRWVSATPADAALARTEATTDTSSYRRDNKYHRRDRTTLMRMDVVNGKKKVKFGR